jgi:hypothetical protein
MNPCCVIDYSPASQGFPKADLVESIGLVFYQSPTVTLVRGGVDVISSCTFHQVKLIQAIFSSTCTLLFKLLLT